MYSSHNETLRAIVSYTQNRCNTNLDDGVARDEEASEGESAFTEMASSGCTRSSGGPGAAAKESECIYG